MEVSEMASAYDQQGSKDSALAPPSSRASNEPPADSSVSFRNGAEFTLALRMLLEPQGFECHPLLVGWYNERVSASFRLAQPPATLAFVIISTPDMFERCFVQHLRRHGRESHTRRDPLDACMRHVLSAAAHRVHPAAVVLHDFELSRSRRPRALVQTAGHVSGAVRLYRRAELATDPWPADLAVSGVCLHPEYGGWFALRALVVMNGVQAPDLQPISPPDILTSEEQKRQLLELFNWHWRDWRYRDLAGARRRYSPLQCHYFGTPPGQRGPLVDRIIRGELPTPEDADDSPLLAVGPPAPDNSRQGPPAPDDSRQLADDEEAVKKRRHSCLLHEKVEAG